MLWSLIEKYPQINYLLAGLALLQVCFFLYIGLDLLEKQDKEDEIELKNAKNMESKRRGQDKKLKTQ